MKIEQTNRGTYEVAWSKGALEVNLVPANPDLKTTSYASAAFNGQMIYLHDNVGITALRLDGCPPVPRICWDNREHHFWRGFNGGFRPRNTVVNDVKISRAGDNSHVRISCYYIVDFVKTTVAWLFREPQEDQMIAWDTSFSFENLSGSAMEKYMAFFACYHQPGVNYHWDVHDRISACADSFTGYSNEERKQRHSEITAAYSELTKGWTAGIENPTRSKELYGNPVLLSEPREWYCGGRHILMVEPGKCLNITSAMRQARDYMLAPAETDLKPGAVFTAIVRHAIAKIDGMRDLRRHWDRFLCDIAGSL